MFIRHNMDFLLKSIIFAILRSTSNPQIHVRFLHHKHLYHRSMSFFKFSNLWPFLTFSNRCPMMLLTYALTLTNKSALDLRIWKGRWFDTQYPSMGPWFEIMTLVDTYLSPDAGLSLSHLLITSTTTKHWLPLTSWRSCQRLHMTIEKELLHYITYFIISIWYMKQQP